MDAKGACDVFVAVSRSSSICILGVGHSAIASIVTFYLNCQWQTGSVPYDRREPVASASVTSSFSLL